jgi:hypothetical protein
MSRTCSARGYKCLHYFSRCRWRINVSIILKWILSMLDVSFVVIGSSGRDCDRGNDTSSFMRGARFVNHVSICQLLSIAKFVASDVIVEEIFWCFLCCCKFPCVRFAHLCLCSGSRSRNFIINVRSLECGYACSITWRTQTQFYLSLGYSFPFSSLKSGASVAQQRG